MTPLPAGCIGADALRSLADALDRLDTWQASFEHAKCQDRPCLRRVEHNGDQLRAYVSVGPNVGGSWFIFALARTGWYIISADTTHEDGL